MVPPSPERLSTQTKVEQERYRCDYFSKEQLFEGTHSLPNARQLWILLHRNVFLTDASGGEAQAVEEMED